MADKIGASKEDEAFAAQVRPYSILVPNTSTLQYTTNSFLNWLVPS